MTVDASVVIPTWNGARRLERLLDSLTPADHQVIVVDNGSIDGTRDLLSNRFPEVEVIRFAENLGFSRAVNVAARAADSRALVLVNDDCVCEPRFVERLAAALDPSSGTVMAAGVLREARNPSLIDTAGMELDETLLVFDYLNGEPVRLLKLAVADPVGPCAAAAALDREAFLSVGGFDEKLFAYWEDVDLVLRLRRDGGRCVLAKDARGTHDHSATLGAGSAAKNYLTGFGRGYMLRKWDVVSGAGAERIALRELSVVLGQCFFDRTVSGLVGRVHGVRAASTVRREAYPATSTFGPRHRHRLESVLYRRFRRRRRLRAEAFESA